MVASNCGNFIYANYFPAGNMQGQFQKNVLMLGTKLPEENLDYNESTENGLSGLCLSKTKSKSSSNKKV